VNTDTRRETTTKKRPSISRKREMRRFKTEKAPKGLISPFPLLQVGCAYANPNSELGFGIFFANPNLGICAYTLVRPSSWGSVSNPSRKASDKKGSPRFYPVHGFYPHWKSSTVRYSCTAIHGKKCRVAPPVPLILRQACLYPFNFSVFDGQNPKYQDLGAKLVRDPSHNSTVVHKRPQPYGPPPNKREP
jgi:hypothetical protein